MSELKLVTINSFDNPAAASILAGRLEGHREGEETAGSSNLGWAATEIRFRICAYPDAATAKKR